MLKNIIKKIINVFGQVNDNPRRNVRCVKCRKLGFEVLEGRELLSAVGLDDNFYDNTFDYNETFYSNDYYESGSVSGYSESNTYDEFDQNQENTMSSGKGECNIFSLSGPTATNGLVPTFSEATQDTFNVTINNESLLMDNICSDGDFQLIFGGTASKDDFAIYDGNNLISNDTTSWSNNTVFFYSIPVGATSVTLTFKIIDNQFLEPSTENLTISVGCVSSGGEMGGCVCMIDTISVTIINDSFSVEWQTIDGT
ncbi:MAG: hypothetical protein LBP59_13000, partial [Planctomycetaceae bacterium]|nr:hypothetical protein [Planctomycetaceae bacterium]